MEEMSGNIPGEYTNTPKFEKVYKELAQNKPSMQHKQSQPVCTLPAKREEQFSNSTKPWL